MCATLNVMLSDDFLFLAISQSRRHVFIVFLCKFGDFNFFSAFFACVLLSDDVYLVAETVADGR